MRGLLPVAVMVLFLAPPAYARKCRLVEALKKRDPPKADGPCADGKCKAKSGCKDGSCDAKPSAGDRWENCPIRRALMGGGKTTRRRKSGGCKNGNCLAGPDAAALEKVLTEALRVGGNVSPEAAVLREVLKTAPDLERELRRTLRVGGGRVRRTITRNVRRGLGRLRRALRRVSRIRIRVR